MDDKPTPISQIPETPADQQAPVWPPPIEDSAYDTSDTSVRPNFGRFQRPTFSFTAGLLAPFVLGIAVLACVSHWLNTMDMSTMPGYVNANTLLLFAFVSANLIAFGLVFVMKKIFRTNMKEYGIGVLTGFGLIGLACAYLYS